MSRALLKTRESAAVLAPTGPEFFTPAVGSGFEGIHTVAINGVFLARNVKPRVSSRIKLPAIVNKTLTLTDTMIL